MQPPPDGIGVGSLYETNIGDDTLPVQPPDEDPLGLPHDRVSVDCTFPEVTGEAMLTFSDSKAASRFSTELTLASKSSTRCSS